jgi:DNA invertase Pin-like site-specific DNA recombinase
MSPTTASAQGQQSAPATVQAVVCYARTANPGAVGQQHLQRQRAKLQVACTVRGWTVLEWIEDLHQSGATLDRPGLHRALALLADHQADALLATDVTALAVGADVASQLAAFADRQGWQLLTVTPTPTSTAGTAATMANRSPGPGRGGARR